MAVFTRNRVNPPSVSHYSRYRPQVREDFRECCAYCLLHEFYAGGEDNFELDHFRPKSKFPSLKNDFLNLYYSCHVCNRHKWNHWPEEALQKLGDRYVDFCAETHSEHFKEESDGTWTPLTKAAEYTVMRLRLNREHLKKMRCYLASQQHGVIEWDLVCKDVLGVL